MELEVNGHIIKYFERVSIRLKYDSIADVFSFKAYYDPFGRVQDAYKQTFKPAFQPCKITHNGKLVMNGTILQNEFSSSAKKELSTIAGYSVTGIFHDSSVPDKTLDKSPTLSANETDNIDKNGKDAEGSIQFTNSSLKDIATTITNRFGFASPVIDPVVSDECNMLFTSITAEPSETVESFLARLANTRHIILSHTPEGQILFTRSKARKKNNTIAQAVQPIPVSNDITGAPNSIAFGTYQTPTEPIAHFEIGKAGCTKMYLTFNGQGMHSRIDVVGQQDSLSGTNSPDSSITNPYVSNTFRYLRVIQNAGDDNDTPLTARNVLSQELKSIALNLELNIWELGGNLIRPNNIITVTNPDIYIFNPTRFLIQDVNLEGDTESNMAYLTCVLPEVYNDDDVKNIFN